MRDVDARLPEAEHYAGFSIRVAANVLDLLMLAATSQALLFVADHEPTGGRPSAWQCIGRYVVALVALACAGIGYFYIAVDPRKQGWHDKLVRTLVVRCGSAG
ncbi:MAG: RDD family protein [Vicinamibacteraceae bacterium]